MHVLHGIAEFDTESTENVPLPGIIFGVDFSLDLFVVDDNDAERTLCFRIVES